MGCHPIEFPYLQSAGEGFEPRAACGGPARNRGDRSLHAKFIARHNSGNGTKVHTQGNAGKRGESGQNTPGAGKKGPRGEVPGSNLQTWPGLHIPAWNKMGEM